MKGICFKEPLFHAVVNGTKTQTRRIVKTEKIFDDGTRIHEYEDGSWVFFNSEGYMLERIKPKYQVGERVYLKEPYFINRTNHNKFEKYVYGIYWKLSKLGFPFVMMCDLIDASNMDIKYARYFIEITGVRCERLQDISDEDCLKEGIYQFSYACEETHWKEKPCYNNGMSMSGVYSYKTFYTPREAYAALIDEIYGKGTWESNPYVWVYDFKILKK